MRLAVHLAAADLRRLWPGLLALIGLHVLRVTAVEVSPLLAADTVGSATLMSGAEPLLLIVEVAATLLAVSAIVHGDPLVGRRAFWLTRPIPPRTLLLAKALTLSPLVIVPIVVNAGRLVAYGAGLEAAIVSSLQLALSRASWIGTAWLIAAVTPSTMAFLLAGIVVWVLFVVNAVVTHNIVQSASDGLTPLVAMRPIRPQEFVSWTTLAVSVVASGAILAWQYQARRRGAAAALIALTLLALANGGSLLPVVLPASEPEPPAWFSALDARRITLADHRITGDTVATNQRPRAITYLTGRLDVPDLPADYEVRLIPRVSRLSAGGRVHEGRGRARTMEAPQRRLELVLANTTLSHGAKPASTTVNEPPGDGATTIQVAYADSVAPFLNRVVRVDAELDIWLKRHRLFATLPLRPGAAVRHRRSLFEVTRVGREGRQVVVRVRHARFPSLLPEPPAEVQLAIYEADTRTWSAIAQTRSIGDTFSGFGFYLSLPLSPYEAPWASAWQSIHEVRTWPPGAGDTRAWESGLQLLLVESVFAGRITRHWSDDRVYVAGEPLR